MPSLTVAKYHHRRESDPGAQRGIERSLCDSFVLAQLIVHCPHSVSARTRPSGRLALLTLLVVVGCGGGAQRDTIDREVFISTYADLRMAALDTDSSRVGEAERDAILQEHGVTADELTTFADVHGEDLEYMRDVWADVELRLDTDPDAASPSGA